jgi:hypothetical protein
MAVLTVAALAVALGIGVVVAAIGGGDSKSNAESAGGGVTASTGKNDARARSGNASTTRDARATTVPGKAGSKSEGSGRTTARNGGAAGGPAGTSSGGKIGSTQPPSEVPPEIVAAYTDGYRGECARLWTLATSDARLWDPDDPGSLPHTVDECYAGLDVFFAGAWDTVADAREGGGSDADTTAEGMTVGNRFRNSNGVIFAIP